VKHNALFLLILLTLLPHLGATQRVEISTGHTQRINEFSYLHDQKLLFTVGDDGTLRIWDSEPKEDGRGALRYKFQISHLPIVKLAVHPTEPYVALIETDRINTYHLSLWNYQSREKLFSHKIDEVPLFMKFSSQGTYLSYGITDWESLTFLDPETGQVEQVLPRSFGIVSDVFYSASEKTMLSYSPSGTLRYWDLESGEEKASFSTVGDLLNTEFSSNGVYMTGLKGRSVYLVNLMSGAVEARREFENLRGISLDAEADRLLVYFSERGRPRFQELGIDRRGQSFYFNAVSSSFRAPDFAQPPLLLDDELIYFCRDEGEIYTQNSFSGEERIFAGSVLLGIDDIAIGDDSVLFVSAEKILSITSRTFHRSTARTNFSSRIFDNPLKVKSGILALDEEHYLLYPTEEPGERLYLFDGNSFHPLETKLTAPIRGADLYGNNALLLEKNGVLRLLNPIDEEELFSYRSFGLQTAVKSYRNDIILARNRTELIDTTLLQINPVTSETVPINDRNLLTFELDYDTSTRSLYSLGFERRQNSIRTVLKRHQGSNYGRVSTLLSYPGEDNSASLAIDPETSRVFTSLGYGEVHMFAWDGFSVMEKIEHIPRKLYVHRGRLFSLNSDSSVSMWDISTGKLELSMTVFDNLSWAVRRSDGSYFATEGAKRWINDAE